LLHRIRLNYEALADGKTGAQVLHAILHELGDASKALNGQLVKG
jgi:hypothetical protein